MPQPVGQAEPPKDHGGGEAKALARFLTVLTEGVTLRELQDRYRSGDYKSSKSVWGQYRSGEKLIPLALLLRVVRDRFPRDATAREAMSAKARTLHTAAAAAAAAAPRPDAAARKQGRKDLAEVADLIETLERLIAQLVDGLGTSGATPADGGAPPGHGPAEEAPGPDRLLSAAYGELGLLQRHQAEARRALTEPLAPPGHAHDRPGSAADPALPVPRDPSAEVLARLHTELDVRRASVALLTDALPSAEGREGVGHRIVRGVILERTDRPPAGDAAAAPRPGPARVRNLALALGVALALLAAGAYLARDPHPGPRPAALPPNDSAPTGLFAVSTDHQHVRAWSGTGTTWTDIGPSARDLLAGPAGLFLTDPATGDLYRYDGVPGHWSKIGTPGRQFAVGGDHLYAIKEDGTAVLRWDSGTAWTVIGSAAVRLYAGGAGLFAVDPATGGVNRYNGTGTTPADWTPVGGPGADYAVDNDHLYALAPDRGEIRQWSGTPGRWQRIGGPATGLHAGGAGLFAVDTATGRILKYDGTPMAWTPIGDAGADLAVGDHTVYRLSADHSAVSRWDGPGTGWTPIGTPAAAITATR